MLHKEKNRDEELWLNTISEELEESKLLLANDAWYRPLKYAYIYMLILLCWNLAGHMFSQKNFN